MANTLATYLSASIFISIVFFIVFQLLVVWCGFNSPSVSMRLHSGGALLVLLPSLLLFAAFVIDSTAVSICLTMVAALLFSACLKLTTYAPLALSLIGLR